MHTHALLRNVLAKHDRSIDAPRSADRDAAWTAGCASFDQARSKRSRFMTLFQAETKSRTNTCCASLEA